MGCARKGLGSRLLSYDVDRLLPATDCLRSYSFVIVYQMAITTMASFIVQG